MCKDAFASWAIGGYLQLLAEAFGFTFRRSKDMITHMSIGVGFRRLDHAAYVVVGVEFFQTPETSDAEKP